MALSGAKDVSSSKLRGSFKRYLDRIEKGEAFRVTRREKVVAVLLPCDVFKRLIAGIPADAEQPK